MGLTVVAMCFDVDDPGRVGGFWASLLERPAIDDGDAAGPAVLVPGDGPQVGLRFVAEAAPRSGPNTAHLHVTTVDVADERRTIATALRLGARHVDVGQLPEEPHIVLADPGGDPWCVIGPGNRFLAGCGRLGEVTCEGTRRVGLFWRDALGWPLVWDQDGETAVQSPGGGTKISWGGEAPVVGRGPSRARLELGATDVAAERERLLGLGATARPDRHGRVALADPDGNELWLRDVGGA